MTRYWHLCEIKSARVPGTTPPPPPTSMRILGINHTYLRQIKKKTVVMSSSEQPWVLS